MIANEPTITIPLRTDEHGTIYVGSTRVTLDSIVNFYLQGETPEDLHQGFSTVALADIYAVIAYYLTHRADVDAYLKQRTEEAARIQKDIEAAYPPKITRSDLQARLDTQQRNRDSD